MKINTMKLKLTALLLVLYTGLYAQNKIVLTAPRLDTSSLSNRINLKANTNLNNVNGVLSSTYGGAGIINGILKANGSGVVSAAVNNSDFTLLNGTGFVRMSGTTPSYLTGASSQFVKADGSLDGNTYATTSALSGYLPLSGGTLTGALSGTSLSMSGGANLATSSGSVLVGAISSGYQNGLLTVGNLSADATLGIVSAGSAYLNKINFGDGGFGDKVQIVANSSADFYIQTRASGTGSLTEKFRITSGGNTLIKAPTDNGTDALQVAGSGLFKSLGQILTLETTTARGSGSNYLSFTDPTGSKGYIGYGSGSTDDFIISNALSANMLFYVNGSQRLTIATTGAITASSSVTASSLIKSGGTSSQFLMADGSVTAGPFMDLSSNQTAAGNKTFSGITSITNTTAATGTTNGALVVSGGVGVGGSVIASAMAANSGTFYNSVYGAVIRSATATYTTTATVASDITTAFCSGSGYTLTLPSASGITGQLLTVISNTNLTGITLSGVEGTTYTLICNSSLVLVSNGTTWKIASVYQNSGSCS